MITQIESQMQSLRLHGMAQAWSDYSGDMHPVIPVICTQFGG